MMAENFQNPKQVYRPVQNKTQYFDNGTTLEEPTKNANLDSNKALPDPQEIEIPVPQIASTDTEMVDKPSLVTS